MLFCGEVVAAEVGCEAFDGVAQGGARHFGRVFVEVAEQERLVAFADFAQHPAYGLVHKMVRMCEEAVGQAEREVEASGAYHSPGGDYRHAFAPQVAAFRELEQDVVGFRETDNAVAEYFRCYHIDEVPVVASVYQFNIKRDGILGFLGVGVPARSRASILADKAEETREPDFVV